MKLNATAEMIPVTWPEFSDVHPFAPREQTDGYVEMIASLNADLCKITGFDAVRPRGPTSAPLLPRESSPSDEVGAGFFVDFE